MDNEIGSAKQKIGDFYKSGMNIELFEQSGLENIGDLINSIDLIKNKTDLIKVTAKLHSYGVNALFDFFIGRDLQNSEKNIINISQGVLSLPERDYYLADDENSKNILSKYKEHLQNVF